MKQIRIRFIRIALLALSLAMLLVAGAINAVHIVSTFNEQRETLQYVTDNQNNLSKKKQGNAFGGDNHANRIPQLYQFADPWRLAVRMEEHDL